MRKFLLTFVVLVAGAMSAWAEDVATVGGNTPAKVVEQPEIGVEVITLTEDVTLTETWVIEAGKKITLDLNGHTISQAKKCTESYAMILNRGDLTITGNGTIRFEDTSEGDPSFGWGSYTLRNEGTLVVENGTIIEHLGEQPFATHMICAIFQYSGSTTINGGKISTPAYRSVRLWKGDMTINGGTFEGQVWVQSVDDSAVLTINGGTFAPRGRDGSSVFVGNVTTGGVHHTAGFSVTGGTFTTKIGCSDTEKLTGDRITGGTFSAAAVASLQGTNLLAEGAELGEPGADGYCTVVSPSDILVINSLKEFIAFRDSVNADNADNSFEGKIVRLNTDIDLRELDWSESIGKDCGHPFKGVFDGNDKTINYLKTYSDEFALSRNYTGLFGVISGNAVIKDLVLENVSITLNCEGQYVGAVVAYANTEAGIIENVKILVGGEIPFLKVGASDVGGVGSIVGYAAQSALLKITGCEVKGKEGKIGTITGAEYVGGLIGYASSGVTIEGNVVNQLKVEGTEYVGGLVGYASNDVVIVGNTVQNLTVQGKSSVGAIAGKILTGGQVVDNTITNVQVSATVDANTAAVVAGTFEDGVIISGTDMGEEVKVNGTSVDSNVLGTAVKVGDVYYTTLEAAYNDESSDVTSIELLGEHELSEAVSYTQNKDVVVNGDLTYTRKLTEHWNPLYLPFEYEFDAENYDVAEFTSADGTTLTLTHVEGTNVLEANKAYVIRPKSEAAKASMLEIKLDKKTLKAATANIIDLNRGYSVKGNNIMYSGEDFRTEFGDNSLVVGINGNWGKLNKSSTLRPFRLILTIPSGAGAVSMRFVKGTTVVEEVELDMQQAEAIFDLSGRRVETMTEGGVYIVNGKKVIF